MGIPGLLKEIGKGERVALAKLAVDHLKKKNRPLRIAIDAAIWNFQTQASHGGKNPALRTLFYRLLRILALPIHPVFVYDGPNRPLSKRGRTVSRWGMAATTVPKELLQHFRFPCHVAPGEAEAECALLQKTGIVDMVMSEDVDAIVFGSGVTLRDWSYEGTAKGNRTPTHVYKLDWAGIEHRLKFDRDGMILVALLSGGDYDPDGVTGFGPGLACEIARAKFGQDLLQLVRTGASQTEMSDWRARLQFELEENESGFFRRRHSKLKIPHHFPKPDLLGYYTNPAVSEVDVLREREKEWIKIWDSEINISQLRDYVGQMFEWVCKPGACKFVRVMAPALLAYKLRRGMAEQLVRTVHQITELRSHISNDGMLELRVTAIPADVVGIDLEAEEDGPDKAGAAEAEDLDVEVQGGDDKDDQIIVPTATQMASRQTKKAPWLPTNPEKMWISAAIVKLGAPAIVQEWETMQKERLADPNKFATRKSKLGKATKSKAAPVGQQSMHKFLSVSKPGAKGPLLSSNKAEAASAAPLSAAAAAPPPPAPTGGDNKSVANARPPLAYSANGAVAKPSAVKENVPPGQSKCHNPIKDLFLAVKAASSKAASSNAASQNPSIAHKKHMLPRPRGSLPGTWEEEEEEEEKEEEGEEVRATLSRRSRARRDSAVSYVDLTAD